MRRVKRSKSVVTLTPGSLTRLSSDIITLLCRVIESGTATILLETQQYTVCMLLIVTQCEWY